MNKGEAACGKKQCSFFSRYVGEIISEAEADMRQIDAYLFSLDDKVKRQTET